MVAATGLAVAACGTRPNSSNSVPTTLSSGDTPGAPAPGASSTAAAGTGSAAADCSYISVARLSSIEGAKYTQPTVYNNQICTWVGNDGNAVSITLAKNATGAAGVGLEIAVQHGSTIIDIRNGDSPGFGKWPKSAAIANAIISGLH